MPYCTKCGKKVTNGALYCSYCGTKVVAILSMNNTKKYIKCPYCGGSVVKDDDQCPYCGSLIIINEPFQSVNNFSEQLMRLENQRYNEKVSIKEKLVNAFVNPTANYKVSKVDQQIVSFIKSYPIPNTIEEITEFMYMAIANIDVNLSKNTILNNTPGARMGGGASREISDAWVYKLQQLYRKAERYFPNDRAFDQVKDIYITKMKELKIKIGK